VIGLSSRREIKTFTFALQAGQRAVDIPKSFLWRSLICI
jgi:hypothetical protein